MLAGFRAFWRQAGPARKFLVFLWGLGMVVSLLRLVLPQETKNLTELFQHPGGSVSWRQVNEAVAFLVGAQVLVAGLNFLRGRLMDRVRERLIYDATVNSYRRVIRFEPEFFHDNDPEEINSRVLEDTKTSVTFWFDVVARMPVMIAAILIFGTFMVEANWFFALCLIPLCFLSAYFLLFDKRIREINHGTESAWSRVRAHAKEYVRSIDEVRPNNTFGYGMRLLDGAFQRYQHAMEKSSRLHCFFNVANPLVETIQSGTLYWLGAALCLLTLKSTSVFGPVSWGDVLKFMFTAELFKHPVKELTDLILDWRMTTLNLERVREYEDIPVAFPEEAALRVSPAAPGAGTGYRGVEVTTASGVRLLSQVTLEVRDGQHVAFVGPAGCGKSTAIRLLVKGNRISGGQVVFRDMKLEEISLGALAREVGVVQQTPYLLNSSLRKNLLFALRRPSARSLQDEDGDIDIEPLAEVKTMEELDRELVRKIQAVGLESDVLHKALEAQIPPAWRDRALVRQLEKIRQSFKQSLPDESARTILPFDRKAYLKQGTLGDNVLFGLRLKNGAPVDEQSPLLPDCLQEAGLLDPILQSGLKRLQGDFRLAASLTHRTPELEAVLKLASQESGQASVLRPPLLAAGKAKFAVRAAVLRAAFEGDARWMVESVQMPDFETRIIAARNSLREQLNRSGREYEDYLTPGRLDGLTLREVLLQGRVDETCFRAPETVDQALRDCLAGLGLLDEALLLGLEYEVGENGRFLSGGQRQKLAIARTLLKRPSLLLLDEATSALDELSQKRIVDLIEAEFKNKMVVSISHRLSTIRDCDRIFVFDRGSLVQQGTYDELAEQPGLFRSLLTQQETGASPPGAKPEPGAAPPAIDRADIKHQLAQCGLFGSLKTAQLEMLARVARIVRCDAHTVLFRRGDAGDELFVVLDGTVEFFVEETTSSGERRESIEGEAGPGQAFGEIAVFSGEVRTLGARTRTESSLCLIKRDSLMKVVESSPTMAASLLQTLAQRITRVREQRYGAAPR